MNVRAFTKMTDMMDRELIVCLDDITLVIPSGTGCSIYFTNGCHWVFKDSFDDVGAMLNNLYKLRALAE